MVHNTQQAWTKNEPDTEMNIEGYGSKEKITREVPPFSLGRIAFLAAILLMC